METAILVVQVGCGAMVAASLVVLLCCLGRSLATRCGAGDRQERQRWEQHRYTICWLTNFRTLIL